MNKKTLLIISFISIFSITGFSQVLDSLIKSENVSWIASSEIEYQFEEEDLLFFDYQANKNNSFLNRGQLVKLDLTDELEQLYNCSHYFENKLIEAEEKGLIEDTLEKGLSDYVYQTGAGITQIDSNTVRIVHTQINPLHIKFYKVRQIWYYDELSKQINVINLDIVPMPLFADTLQIEKFKLKNVLLQNEMKSNVVKWIVKTANLMNLENDFKSIKGKEAKQFLNEINVEKTECDYVNMHQFWSLNPDIFNLTTNLEKIELLKSKIHLSEAIFVNKGTISN